MKSLFSIIGSTIRFCAQTLKSVILIGAILLFVGQATIVQGLSMEPNLHGNDRLLIDKLTYEFFEPQRGDIVVIEVAEIDVPLIKRVIGLAGETIEIRSGIVYVNGIPLSEPYLNDADLGDFGPVVVSAEHVFVLGDNRPISRDSRSFGSIDVYRIVGKARVRLWPPESFGMLE